MSQRITGLTERHVQEMEVASIIWVESEVRMLERMEAAVALFETRLHLITNSNNFSYIRRLLHALAGMMTLICAMFGQTWANRLRRDLLSRRVIVIFGAFGLIIYNYR